MSGYFRTLLDINGEKGRMVWAGDGGEFGGWGELMLWSFQRYNNDQARIRPHCNVNLPAHVKGTFNSAHTMLYQDLIQGYTIDSEFLG